MDGYGWVWMGEMSLSLTGGRLAPGDVRRVDEVLATLWQEWEVNDAGVE